ncbi:helix-turn-helix transcriptional regulator [Kitasatospora sp. NPDC089797]|uniref:PadR family transcriptional regulator n=1 Tax=Kitasatospora sp. NPDC089797 TaxID=3155298 RepID=UPI0034198E78
MGRRSGVLEFAVLGLLHDAPMHGYELRKRLNILLGALRALSYGTLYPCLKSLVAQGFLVEDNPDVEYVPATALNGKRSKIVYRLSPEGKQRFEELLADSGPDAWEDERFGVHFAFFGQTDRAVRMRVLEGRRSRLEERLERMRSSLARARERFDDYTVELQRHGLESVEREVRWLNELIETERANRTGRPSVGGSNTAVPPTTSDGRGRETGSADPSGPPYDRPGRSAQER